jgi:hypothetical protein
MEDLEGSKATAIRARAVEETALRSGVLTWGAVSPALSSEASEALNIPPRPPAWAVRERWVELPSSAVEESATSAEEEMSAGLEAFFSAEAESEAGTAVGEGASWAEAPSRAEFVWVAAGAAGSAGRAGEEVVGSEGACATGSAGEVVSGAGVKTGVSGASGALASAAPRLKGSKANTARWAKWKILKANLRWAGTVRPAGAESIRRGNGSRKVRVLP